MAEIAIWAAGGPTVGGGHVTRMVALAAALAARSATVEFVVLETAAAMLADRIRGEPRIGITVIGEFSGLASRCAATGSRWVVVDDYEIDATQERLLRQAGTRVLVIDDLADRRHDCDALLDAMPYRRERDYAALIRSDVQLRLGLSYALVHPGIVAWRDRSLARRAGPALERVVATFGLSAATRGASITLEAVALCGFEAAVTLLVADVPATRSLARMTEERRIDVRGAVADPAPLFSASDLAIMAPGVTSLELCALGVPMIQLVTNPHQQRLADDMSQRGAAMTIDLGPGAAERLAATLEALAEDPARLASMSAAAAEAVDGRGAGRIAEFLMAEGPIFR